MLALIPALVLALGTALGANQYEVLLVDVKPTHYEVQVKIKSHTALFFIRGNEYAFMGANGRRTDIPRWNVMDETSATGAALQKIADQIRKP